MPESDRLIETVVLKAAGSRDRSQAKATLGLVVRNALAGVEFIEASLDLGKKHETLDRVIYCRVRRHLAERLDDPITSHLFRHDRILRHVADAGRA